MNTKPLDIVELHSIDLESGAYVADLTVERGGNQERLEHVFRGGHDSKWSAWLLAQVENGIVDVQEISPPDPLPDVQSVRARAETLLEQGTQINGVQFRCDTDSICRLEGLVRGFVRGKVGPEGRTYKTSVGVDITFTTKEQVEAALNAADDYRDGMLERSAQLQNAFPILDPNNPALWDLTKALADILSAEAEAEAA